jgi:hypothetical protein
MLQILEFPFERVAGVVFADSIASFLSGTVFGNIVSERG